MLIILKGTEEGFAWFSHATVGSSVLRHILTLNGGLVQRVRHTGACGAGTRAVGRPGIS